MDSFYGGKPGSPFIIKARFETVAEMKARFCEGPAYKDVWFGEYCIIDAVSNNSYDNGKIYRRTFNYQDEAACAEYICKITGPEGGTPHFVLSGINEIKELVAKDLEYLANDNPVDGNGKPIENPEPDTRLYPYIDDEGKVAYFFDSSNDNEEREPALLSLNISNQMLVPGYDGETFIDDIKYTWCSEKLSPLRDGNYPGQSFVHLGFQVPYVVPRFSIKTVDANQYAGIEQIDYEHPFAPEYVVDIPRGSKPIEFQVEDNGKLTFAYEHTPNTREDAGVIPCIVGAEVREDDCHLWIGFSQPKNEGDEPRIEVTDDGKEIISYWYDYGAVKDEDGILIGGNYESFGLIPKEPREDGKVVTVGNKENKDVKDVYAWDYNDNSGWYYVGSFDGDGKPQIMVASKEAVSEMIISEMFSKNLKENGVCLVTTDFDPYLDPMNPAVDQGLIDNCYWWGVGKIQ